MTDSNHLAMTFIKLFAVCIIGLLMLCGNNKSGDTNMGNVKITRPSLFAKSEDSTIKKPDSVIMNVETKSDTTSVIKEQPLIVEKPKEIKKEITKIHPSSPPIKKNEPSKPEPVVIKSQDSIAVVKPVTSALSLDCYSLTGKPLTHQDALDCAQHHWHESLEYFNGNKTLDTAYLHCIKGLSLYENGSLFALKAAILYRMQKYAEAVQAAEVSISRNDHWQAVDKTEAYLTRYLSLAAICKRFPSTAAQNNLKKATMEYENIKRNSP